MARRPEIRRTSLTYCLRHIYEVDIYIFFRRAFLFDFFKTVFFLVDFLFFFIIYQKLYITNSYLYYIYFRSFICTIVWINLLQRQKFSWNSIILLTLSTVFLIDFLVFVCTIPNLTSPKITLIFTVFFHSFQSSPAFTLLLFRFFSVFICISILYNVWTTSDIFSLSILFLTELKFSY